MLFGAGNAAWQICRIRVLHPSRSCEVQYGVVTVAYREWKKETERVLGAPAVKCVENVGREGASDGR